MVRKSGLVLVLLFSVHILCACSNDEPVTERNSTACSGDDVPPYDLQNGPGWTWLGLTTGTSTEQDVIAEFGVPDLTRLWPEDNPQVCIYVYTEGPNNRFRVWLAGNEVIGLEFGQLYPNPAFRGVEIPQTFEELKETYGRAQLVGFSRHGYGVRSVVWLEQGIQAEFSLYADETPVRTIRYFSSMNEKEFGASPWSTLVLEENPSLDPKSDLRDSAPQDPFDWD